MALVKAETTQQVFQQMEPELIESRIGFLIWRYQVSRSIRMARAVVTHIEALCSHPDTNDSDGLVCTYRRTLQMWRVLAQGTPNAVEG
ncbi:MAG: ATP dependent RNA helicase [Candidatus Thiodiazotropha taylori]|nr:ATP dependent RNA helicase [Candidatus Thiodiazotropha taylori]MCG7963209.1 ATP dependent RNA helicase [Candidatus Thiodiazotropha endolucinida]MCG7967610.1 ATP dependent RNA helicase [Candidatus Thiodiazotropha taylori]MCG7994557.1 ATP dependent RNA helicase [Candidatus Thiodiazotropha taylori]MCG8053440.1 ATP dependent RNA helicase [Candidatus Thiodiazotropha taylori]